MSRHIRLGLAILSLALVACSQAPGASPTPSPTPPPTPSLAPTPSPTPSPPPAGLDGRQFLSVDVTQDGAPHDLVPGTRIRITFADGSLSAQAGCNTIGGSYTIDGDRLVFVGGGMTEMGCDPARHAQDDWLVAFLGSRPALRLTGNDLALSSDTTTVTLLDREVAEPDQPLVGPTWILTSIITGDAVSSVPPGVSPTLTFNADGRVDVFPGCNSGGGDYAIDGSIIRFANIALTKMACAGAAGQVEQAVLSVLAAEAITFGIDAASLTLDAGDLGLQFSPTVFQATNP